MSFFLLVITIASLFDASNSIHCKLYRDFVYIGTVSSVKKKMSDSIMKVLRGVLQGFRDSLIGIFNVYQMDRSQSEVEEENSHTAVREAQTVLAKRRAERMKTPVTGTKKDRC
jgi:hypothetical protein